MTKASVAAKEHAIQTKGLSGTTDTFVAKQKVVQTELEATATSSRLASVGVKALSTAFNMFAGMAIMWGITKIIEGFEYLSESAERAKEKLSEIQTELNDNNSTYQSNRSTLVGLKEEYDALTKKAEALGGAQNLANDEYERYQAITSQILGITPKLTTGWNEEGEAISNKNNLLQSSIDLLDEEYEKSLRNNTTKSKNEDVASGVIAKLDEFNNSVDTTTKSGTMADMRESFLNELEKLETELGMTEHDIVEKMWVYFDPDADPNDFWSDHVDTYEELRDLIAKDYDKLGNSFVDENNPIYELFSDEVIDDMIRNADAYFYEGQRILNDREALYQDYKDQLNWNAQATRDKSGNNAYQQLTDNGKAFINEYIEGLDYASIKTEEDFVEMANDIQKFTKLLASNEDVSKLVENIFTPATENETSAQYVERVQKAVADVQQYCKDNYIDLPINFTTLDDVDRMTDGVQAFLSDEFDDKVGELSLSDLQIASELEVDPSTLLSWDELLERIQKVKDETFNNEITVLNFSDAFNAEEFEDTKEKLLELAKSGELSPYTLLSIKEYNSLLEQTGLTAEQAYSEIMKIAQSDMFMENWNNTLENARSQIAKIDELLTELDDNGQTSSFVDDIISDYPQLLEYLGDEQELREQLKALQEEQKDVARKAYTQLVSDSETYYNTFKTQETERLNALNDTINTTISKNKSLVDTLGENYKIDLNNYKSITDAKAKLEMELIKNSASAWSKFYKVEVDATTGYASIIGSTTVSPSEYLDSSGDYGAAVSKFVEEQKKQKQSAQDVVDTYNSIIASLDSIANSTNITDTSSSSSSSKDSSTSFDWIETSLSNMEDILDDLDNKVADTYAKWEDRNKDLADSILKTKEAIELQRDAAKAYEDEASEIKFSSSEQKYLRYVKEGLMDIETIKDKDLADRISNYQDLYEKSIECEKKALELERTLNELSSNEKWDLFKSKSDLQIEGADNIIDYQQSLVDKAELQGLFANEDYYKVMRMQNLRKQSELKKQYAELETILNTVPKGTEAYDTLFNEWMDIRNQLGELENEFIEFNNNIRDLDWEIFEYLEDSISRITEEVDFLKDLLSDEDMFDEYGNMTKYADATMGLHFTNIETYKKLAEDYYGEMQELQQQLADGAGQDVLEKYREYEDLHRDAINSMRDEKNAILDLVQNAYDEQINALERINDLTLERMDRERDLYNYQKNIAEKMKEKTSLERQISVYDGDNSEESIANTQRLKLELEKVNSDIEELQYEKQRADTEQMLTSITDNMKEWQSKRMDDEQGLLEEIKDGISTKSDEIKTTLTEVAGEYGTILSTSLSDIFDKKNPFDNVVTAINNLIDKITGLVSGDSNSDGDSNTPTDNTKPNANTDTKPPTTNNNNQPSQPIDTQSKSETDSIFIPQKSVYPKGELNKDKSATDWLKYHDYASDFSSRAIYYKKLGGSGAYTDSGTQNSWLLKKMKEVGYASGTNYAKAGLHWTQENGDEIIIRKSDGAILTPLNVGDKVVNADGTNNLFDFANDPQGFLEKFGVLNYAIPAVNVKLPDTSVLTRRNTTNGATIGNVNIEVGQVVANDPIEFAKQMRLTLANDRNTQKMVQELGLGQSLGHNSMNVKRYL